MRFRDRQDAGRQLARLLLRYKKENPVVLALPRGGVPVAYQVATVLEAPLDVCVVRKIGAPDQPEHGLGAVAEGGVVYVDRARARSAGASGPELDLIVRQKSVELAERVRRYREGMTAPDLRDRTVILVDDGASTGGSLWAAAHAVRAQNPRKLIAAVAVAEGQVLEELRRVVDHAFSVEEPRELVAIGAWYETFSQVSEEEVLSLLRRARGEGAVGLVTHSGEALKAREVSIFAGGQELAGVLAIPPGATALALFAEGSATSRFGSRNRQVAAELRRRGIATVMVDLFTPQEQRYDAESGALRYDLDFLSHRLTAVADWLVRHWQTSGLRLGLFGAGTAAAAALMVAARRSTSVHSVVCRGARADLAFKHLSFVRAPTLLIVAGQDEVVKDLNALARPQLAGESAMQVVPGATQLFEEPGALERVCLLAGDWFTRTLVLQHPRAMAPVHQLRLVHR
jgi:putative phosphoribosyl transferase